MLALMDLRLAYLRHTKMTNSRVMFDWTTQNQTKNQFGSALAGHKKANYLVGCDDDAILIYAKIGNRNSSRTTR